MSEVQVQETGTDADAEAAVQAAQQQLTADTVRDDPDESLEPDPEEEVREAWREAERARLRTEVSERLQQEQQEAQEAARIAAEERSVAQAFDDAGTEVDNRLAAVPFHLADGTPARLTEAQRKQIKEPFENAATRALEVATRRVYSGLGEAATPLLGKAEAEELQNKAGGKSVEVWLQEFGESYATKSKYLKAMSDSAAEALVKNTPALAALIKAAELREFKRGQKTPEGEPERADRGRTGTGVNYRSKAEARSLHVAGKLTNAEMKAINRNPSIPEGYE